MGVKAFGDKVLRAVSERLGENYQIKIQEVCKNNGVILQGLVILTENQNISPTIYLNSFWDAYEAGVPFTAIIEKILSVYQEDTPKENVDMSFFKIFEKVKDRICFKVISSGQNQELLKKIPHLEFLDLAVCFYYAYQGATLGCGSILIHNSHLEMWQVDTEIIWQVAQENTPKFFPWECGSMEDVLSEMMNEETADAVPMKILSNDTRVFGASCMLYRGVLEELAAKQGSNFYIIPSSVHEVILLPDSGEEDTDYLRHMIAEVNESQVEPEEVLSNQLYYYDRFSNRVTII